MKYYKINLQNPDTGIIKKAINCLEDGGIVVYPTDTLYGLGVDAFNREAVNKLYLVKQRDMRRPVSIMLHSIQQIKEIFGFSPLEIKEDLEKLFPGKVTAIIQNNLGKKIPIFEDVQKPGTYLKKIGVRIPSDAVSSAIVTMFDSPISSTSANISGMGNVFSIENVIAHLGNVLDLILDAGPIPDSKGSSVVDFTRKPYLILREGDVTESELKKKLGDDRIVLQRNKYIITFVCSGNICRSPIAEALLKKMLAKTKYKNSIKVQSAGILNLPKFPAHRNALEVCKLNDIDLDDHISQPISEKIMNESEIVFCLAQNHYKFLNDTFPKYRKKIVLLKQFGKQDLLSIPSIADPIGHSLGFFKDTYNEIYGEIKRILPVILADKKRFLKFNDL